MEFNLTFGEATGLALIALALIALAVAGRKPWQEHALRKWWYRKTRPYRFLHSSRRP